MIANALADKPLPVYGNGENVRDWLYVEDHCAAISLILHKGTIGEVYNVGGHNERTNLEVVRAILRELDKPESLIAHDGLSIAEIAKLEIGKTTGLVAAISVVFILIITMAGMGIAVANALFNSPWGAFTVGATIPIALFIGIYMRFLRPGHIGEASFVGVLLVLAAVIGGAWIQHSVWAPYFTLSRVQLDIILPLYGFVAAALPIWLLLAPRDYLSTYMKIGTIGALALGIIIVQPVIHMPAITQFVGGGGPVVPGPVWPFVCITVACGAISGFHTIIATGTTPKMLMNEKEILPIGFGAMLAESFIGIMALIAATSLIPADYFAINSAPAVFDKLGMNIQELPLLSQMVGENVAGRPGGAVSLAVGMGLCALLSLVTIIFMGSYLA